MTKSGDSQGLLQLYGVVNHIFGEIAQRNQRIVTPIGIAASLYLEDESTFQRTDGEAVRANVLRTRSIEQLRRLAHLGKVI